MITIEDVKEAILSLGETLKEAEAIGLFGSLARYGVCTKRSDIDVFVVVKQKGAKTDSLWWGRIRDALLKFGRDITVLVYSVKGLKEINNWYVLRLAREGILVYDQGDIMRLFQRILKAAKEAGLEEIKIGESWVWAKKEINWGEKFEVKVG